MAQQGLFGGAPGVVRADADDSTTRLSAGPRKGGTFTTRLPALQKEWRWPTTILPALREEWRWPTTRFIDCCQRKLLFRL